MRSRVPAVTAVWALITNTASAQTAISATTPPHLTLCPISTSLQTLLPFTLNGIHRFYCPSFRVKANIPGFSHGGSKLHQSGTQLQL